MYKKFVLIAMLLVLISSFAFSAPSISTRDLSPALVGQQIVLDFNVIDENTLDTSAFPDYLLIYYSTSSGGFQNLIINDTNLNDGVGVVCADDNFSTSTRCTYNWTVPNVTPNNYFIDYNFIVNPEGVGYTDSTSNFRIDNSNGCATLNWAVLVIGLMICFFALMRFLNSTGNINELVMLAITVVIALIIMYTFLAGACVVT